MSGFVARYPTPARPFRLAVVSALVLAYALCAAETGIRKPSAVSGQRHRLEMAEASSRQVDDDEKDRTSAQPTDTGRAGPTRSLGAFLRRLFAPPIAPKTRAAKLIEYQIRLDFYYGADDFFGQSRDMEYAEAVCRLGGSSSEALNGSDTDSAEEPSTGDELDCPT